MQRIVHYAELPNECVLEPQQPIVQPIAERQGSSTAGPVGHEFVQIRGRTEFVGDYWPQCRKS